MSYRRALLYNLSKCRTKLSLLAVPAHLSCPFIKRLSVIDVSSEFDMQSEAKRFFRLELTKAYV